MSIPSARQDVSNCYCSPAGFNPAFLLYSQKNTMGLPSQRDFRLPISAQ
jgi:hypothetical protein